MKKYLLLLRDFFFFQLKSKLSYRLNFMVENLHAPIYVSVLFILLVIVFSKSKTLGGINQDEAIFIYLFFNIIYAISFLLFVDGFRNFVWAGLRNGELDPMLTKPINVKFLVSFSRPATEGFLYLLTTSIFFVFHVSKNLDMLNWLSPLYLIIGVLLGTIVMYLTLLTYSSLAFFFTRAQQVVEFFHKINDLGQYPKPIFPNIIQIMMVSVVPMAFFSYYPTLVFLGKISPTIFVWEIVLITSLYLMQRLLWHKGLKKYSSASS